MSTEQASLYTTVYLGRQPIVDGRQQKIAYELLFRSGPENMARFQDDVNATAAVIRHTFIDLGMAKVLEGCPGFINVNERLLRSPVLDLLPPENIILEILETVQLDGALLLRCQELKRRGYRLALDDFCGLEPSHRPFLPILDFIKIDLQQIALAELPALLTQLQGFKGQLLAEKVDSREQFEICKSLGIDLFQGYFFARPTVMTQNRANPHRALMLRLLGLVMQDAPTTALEEVFKSSPDMVVSLLKLVNVAENYGRVVHSVRDAISMLGSARLKRWALIILFSADCQPDQGPSPLLEMAAIRGRMMEALAGPQERDEAFMTGILSLADVLLGMEMSELTATLAVSERVRSALLHQNGQLGRLLRQAMIAEYQDPEEQLPDIDAERFNSVQMEAIQWVRKMWSDEFAN